MDNQIKIEEWETQFDKFTDYYKCTPQFKSYIRTLLKSQRDSRDKKLIDKIILDVVYACAEYTNMHQDTDPENIAVNTVRANILNRLSLLKEDIKN